MIFLFGSYTILHLYFIFFYVAAHIQSNHLKNFAPVSPFSEILYTTFLPFYNIIRIIFIDISYASQL